MPDFVTDTPDGRDDWDKFVAVIKNARPLCETLLDRLQNDVALGGMIRRAHDAMIDISDLVTAVQSDAQRQADAQAYFRLRSGNVGLDLGVRFPAMIAAGQSVVTAIRTLNRAKPLYEATGTDRFGDNQFTSAETGALQTALSDFIASVAA